MKVRKTRRWCLLLPVMLCALCPMILCAKPLTLTACRVFSVGDDTRAVFSLSGDVHYRCFRLSHPDRLVVDLNDAKLAAPLHVGKLKNSVIQNIRTGYPIPHDLRIVLGLKREQDFKTYMLKPYARFGYRLVIDLNKESQTHHSVPKPVRSAQHATLRQASSNAPRIKKLAPSVFAKPISSTEQPQRSTRALPFVQPAVQPTVVAGPSTAHLRDVMVVLDPGHGGVDPGATGPHGIHEKNVVLAIAKDLNADLKQQIGIRSDMTRKGDYFISLRTRLQIARKDHADIFIAIHADAYPDHNAQGASVFALSQRGATSEAARWLAKKENYSELMGGADLADKGYTLRSVLIDLSQVSTIKSSLRLGADVMRSLGHVTRLHHPRVEQAPFVVLKSPDITSILIETGFITNVHEEARLNNPAYQHKVAHAMTDGVMDYLYHNPPRGTIIAARKWKRLGWLKS